MSRKPKVSQLSPEDLDSRRTYHREYMRTHRKVRAYDLRRRYGLTVEQRDELLEQQGGTCAICSGEATCVDHCHTTGNVRGILCSTCNSGLGFFKDQPSHLISAAEYLERHVY